MDHNNTRIITDGNTRIIIEGFDEIIRRDLLLHRGNLERARADLADAQTAIDYLVEHKARYRQLIKEGRYNRERMEQVVREDLNVQIRQASDVKTMATERIEHFSTIVKTLETQLAEYDSDKD